LLLLLPPAAAAISLPPQKIKDKYKPAAADLRAYKQAKAEGKLDEYWAARADLLKDLTGSAAPPTVAATS
jgi:hypothetical protein